MVSNRKPLDGIRMVQAVRTLNDRPTLCNTAWRLHYAHDCWRPKSMKRILDKHGNLAMCLVTGSSIPGKGKIFSFLRKVQTFSGTHSVSNTTSLPGGKAAGPCS